MTLDEKLAQLGSAWIYELADPERASHLMRHGIGQITRIGGASNLKPAESAATANAIQRFLVEQTRLGIPAMVHEECCAGYMARDADRLSPNHRPGQHLAARIGECDGRGSAHPDAGRRRASRPFPGAGRRA